MVEHGDAVGDLHRLLLVVRDEDRRHVHLLVQAAQPVAQLGPHARVEGAERLVEEQDARLRGERAGERHALALAARELATDTGRRSPESWTSSSSSSTRSRISCFGRFRIESAKPTLSRTVMCLNAA